MYQNLKTQMAAQSVTMEQLSKLLNIHRNTVANKLDGGSFTIEEAFKIKDYLFRQYELPYLFKRSDTSDASTVEGNIGAATL